MTVPTRHRIATLAAAILLASCSVDTEQEVLTHVPIRFSAGGLAVTELTRATNEEDLQTATAFAAGEDIAVYVTDRDDASTYSALPYCCRTENAADGKNVLVCMDGTLYYPPNASSTIDAHAFYPYARFKDEANHGNTALAVSVATDQSGARQYRASDVMVATPVTGHSRYPTATNTVHLQFRHVLASIVIRLWQGQHTGTPNVSLTAAELASSTVTLGPVITDATLNMADGTVSTGSTQGVVTVCSDTGLAFYDGTAAQPIEYAIVVPPQDISGTTLTISTAYGRTISGTLPLMTALASGNSHTLNVTVNDTHLAVASTISINDWTKYQWTNNDK